jgi:hypothetical protein
MKWYVIGWLVAVLITDIIIRLSGIQKTWVKQVIPIAVCLIFFFVPWIFDMGFFKGSIIWLLLISLSGGLSANGLFTYAFIQKGLNWLLRFIPKKIKKNG